MSNPTPTLEEIEAKLASLDARKDAALDRALAEFNERKKRIRSAATQERRALTALAEMHRADAVIDTAGATELLPAVPERVDDPERPAEPPAKAPAKAPAAAPAAPAGLATGIGFEDPAPGSDGEPVPATGGDVGFGPPL